MSKSTFNLTMIITAVQCGGCNQALAPNQPIMTTSKEDLVAAAQLLHSKAGIICPQPKLIIMYQPAFVDAILFPDIDKNTLQQSATAGDN